MMAGAARVAEGGEVGEALVDDELVGLGGHGVAVQAVELAEAVVFHRDVLEGAGTFEGARRESAASAAGRGIGCFT
jgi:hypothetical protein